MRYYRWADGTMCGEAVEALSADEASCINDGILSEVVVIDKDKWDRLVELIGHLKHAASEAGVVTRGDEIGDIIQEVEK